MTLKCVQTDKPNIAFNNKLTDKLEQKPYDSKLCSEVSKKSDLNSFHSKLTDK